MFSGRRGKQGTRNPDRPDSIPSLQFNSSEDLVLRPLGRSNPTANLSSTTSASASASGSVSAAADPSSEDESFVHVRVPPSSHSAADAPPALDPPDPNPDPEHALGSPGTSIADEMPSNSIPRRPASSPGLTPFLLGGQPLPASYGSVSPSPTQDMSTDSDPDSDENAPLRRVRGDGRSSTKRKSRSASGSGLSHAVDLDSAVLVTGMEDRFAVPDASMAATVLEDAKATYDKAGDQADGSYQTTVCDEEYGDRGGGGADHEGVDEHDHLDNSPYDVVRASVSPLDNTSLSINTPRMWTLSVLFSFLGSSTNLFFSLRYPSVAITPVIALLLVHPLGHMWDMLLKRQGDPIDEYVDGVRRGRMSDATDAAVPRHLHPPRTRRHRLRLWLAQGRWNEKEHTCVYVSSNIAFGFAFATDVIVEQHKFYGQEVSIVYQLLLTISTQMLGYTFAGITRRFLVRPSGMIWPATLMSASMFSTLHKEENKPANGWTISRWKFFLIVWLSAFLFYFLPGLLFPALSYFNVLTWFAPDNVVVANLFGVVSGLGLFPATFDWAQVTYIGSPLLVPFWAAMNVVGGLVVVMWIAAPLAYYANVYSSAYLPMLSSSVFDNTGKVYDVGRILTPDFLFDRAAYEGYSRVFLPITYVLSYGVQFAGLAALLTHTFCWYGPDIWKTWKSAVRDAREGGEQPAYEPLSGSSEDLPATPTSTVLGEGLPRRASTSVEGMLGKEDVHSRLMKRYQDAPITWYLMTFVSMLAIGIFLVEYYPIHLPWYGLLLALAICAIFFIPNGIIMAVTNQHSSIYLICQLVCGSVFPGRPIANMVFVTYGYISSAQGIKFASDLKLGHYMKVPPRILFAVQMVATLVSSVTQIGVLNWMFANVRGLCTPEAINGFTCPIARVHFNGSILWGVVGPAEFFGPGTMYRALVWFFLVGAVLPIPVWLYSRDRKGSPLRKVNFPVIFGTMGWIPPATGLNFSVWALVCFVFNYLVKRRAGAWWSKYTMTLSAALDSGLAFGIVVVFFGFIYPGVMKGFSWWGTEVYKQGCDWKACAWLKVPEGSRFGPDTW
ncbi:related to sexual differentiation process protein isp4 [Cephalotrichum gorgonifer]|uniref:Related to sexual differentiation process protein isp4 n=1 Tax=Cephalotrichum gorgonifer TaxID=2041049 RepID=A0AAE8SSN0_9PEZI|nr:related to sexual differentiation process protein isp4 [Cephalotrichum gorgonifer]